MSEHVDLNDFFFVSMSDEEMTTAVNDAKRYVIVVARRGGGIVPPVVAILSEAVSVIMNLQNQIEKSNYEHGKAAEQTHRFSSRLGRINIMLDEAGIDIDNGFADERLAKMLNRELPNYPAK